MEKRVLILINKTAGVGKAGNYTLDIVTRFAKAGYEPVVFSNTFKADFCASEKYFG